VGVLRFPNPGSDLTRVVHVFSLMSREFDESEFDLDDMTTVATRSLQASSVGAQGQRAVALSTRDDRSRDPLYNQMKMYSELYRMLGFMRPFEGKRQSFSITELGHTVSDWYWARRQPEWSGLLGQAILATVFPNQTTENLGVSNQRPFVWLLSLMGRLDNVITRHEMISGLLAITDDSDSSAMERAVNLIRRNRGKARIKSVDAAKQIAETNGVQLNTLENYTRFPVGVLKSSVLNWGIDERRTDLFTDRGAVSALVLTPRGQELARSLSEAQDVRLSDLNGLSVEERALFAYWAYYRVLEAAGLETHEHVNTDAFQRGRDVATSAGIDPSATVIFSPALQETDEVIGLATSLDVSE